MSRLIWVNINLVKRNQQNGVFLSLNIVFILANSTDADEKTFHGTFHLGLHCLPNCIQNEGFNWSAYHYYWL